MSIALRALLFASSSVIKRLAIHGLSLGCVGNSLSGYCKRVSLSSPISE